MKLRITSVEDRGSGDRELVLLTAMEPCDAGDFVVARATAPGARQLDPAVRLPRQALRRGDQIALWTRPGHDTWTAGPGSVMYHVHWGLPGPIWAVPGAEAVALEAPVEQRLPADQGASD